MPEHPGTVWQTVKGKVFTVYIQLILIGLCSTMDFNERKQTQRILSFVFLNQFDIVL